MTEQDTPTHLDPDPPTNLPELDGSLLERLKEWAGEITDPPIPAKYDDTKTNPVTGQPRTP